MHKHTSEHTPHTQQTPNKQTPIAKKIEICPRDKERAKQRLSSSGSGRKCGVVGDQLRELLYLTPPSPPDARKSKVQKFRIFIHSCIPASSRHLLRPIEREGPPRRPPPGAAPPCAPPPAPAPANERPRVARPRDVSTGGATYMRLQMASSFSSNA